MGNDFYYIKYSGLRSGRCAVRFFSSLFKIMKKTRERWKRNTPLYSKSHSNWCISTLWRNLGFYCFVFYHRFCWSTHILLYVISGVCVDAFTVAYMRYIYNNIHPNKVYNTLTCFFMLPYRNDNCNADISPH